MSVMGGLVRRSTTIAALRARSFAEANMLATVKIERPVEPVFDRATGQLGMAPDSIIYEGKARVYGVSGPATYSLGDEPQYFSSTQVSIPIGSASVRVDDVIQVTAHDDPALVGRFFRVQDAESGGQMPVVHRMQVIGIQPSRQWSQA